jgi:hypothetical protein
MSSRWQQAIVVGALVSAACSAPAGQQQPKSLGTTHIDEQGALSDALTQVYLPQRAQVLSTYLQACDAAAIERNLQPAPERLTIE